MRRYLIAGLLVWVPLGITFLVVSFLVNLMDRLLVLLPEAWRPDVVLGFHVPGLGFILAFAVVLLTGVAVANFIGRRLVSAWESLLARIPLVRSVYAAVKQLLQGVFSAGSSSFRRVLLIEYPRKGIWTVGFQTGDGAPEIEDKIGESVVTVFVPTTPNPTSGFILMVPLRDTRELDMSVEDGLKLIMSLGVVTGTDRDELARGQVSP